MDCPKCFIKKGINLVFFRPRVLLSYLPDDLKDTVCAALDVDSLEDDELVFDYDPIQDCFSASKSFGVVVTVNEGKTNV